MPTRPLLAIFFAPCLALAAPLPPAVQEAMQQGYQSSDPQTLAHAAQVMEEQLQTDPVNADLRRALGILYLDRLHAPAKALPHLEKAAADSPDDAAWQQALARALRESGRAEQAATHYRKAADLQPGDAWARYELANTLSASGHYAEAADAYRAALERDPKNTGARLALAKTLWAANRPDEAAREARAVLEYDPLNAAARRLLTTPPSAPNPASAPAAKRTSPVDAAVAAAYASGSRADFQRAARMLEESLRRAPGDLARRKSLGFLYLEKLNAPAEAVPHLEKVAAATPRDAAWLQMLAKAQAAAGDRAAAAATWRRAAEAAPRDVWARYHLGRALRDRGRGDDADTAFREALALDPSNRSIRSEIAPAQRPQAKLSFYTFEDTDDLRQTGVFTHVRTLLTGRVGVSVSANERFFKRPPGETVERFEAGLAFDYRFNGSLQLAAGISQFKTQNLGRETGANIALYVTPASALDASISYRHADPVNDSYTTARESFTQNILAAGLTFRPARTLAASLTASTADYSDGNTRRGALASLAWSAPRPASPVVRLEYEWLDFAAHTAAYSSPQNYARLRPVIEFAPRLTDWLKLEFHGELSYVFDAHEWGTGFTVGTRFTAGDWFDLGLTYMNYAIPGGQTTWSGEGFKVDLSARF